MTHILIDLGEVPERRGTPGELPARRPPVPYRALLGALSVVLLALLAGAATVRPAPAPTVIPARLGDTTYFDGDLMFVVGSGGEDVGATARERTVSVYRLPAARLTGRSTVTVAGAVIGVVQTGDTLIVGNQLDASGSQEVAAYRLGGDRLLWRRTARLIAATDGTVLLSAADGDYALDAATGALRWRVPRPPNGFLADTGLGAGYPGWLVVLTDKGRLETWDAHTGRRVGTTTIPPQRDRITGMMAPVGGLLMVAGAGGYYGYRLPGLQRLWHTDVDLSQSWMQSGCGTVICTYRQQRGMTVLDAATGRLLWSSGHWAEAAPLGPYLLATASAVDDDAVPALSVLDPRTGKVLGDFGGWQGLAEADGGLIYGMRDVPGKYEVWYGVLDPATRGIDPIGLATRVSGGCGVAGGAMVCRLVDASVAVWRLR